MAKITIQSPWIEQPSNSQIDPHGPVAVRPQRHGRKSLAIFK